MKKTNKIILATIIAITITATLTAFRSTSTEEKIIMVRVWEPTTNQLSPIILVTDGKKILKNETINILREKYYDSNCLRITSVLNEYKSQGYNLVASNINGEYNNMTTYIFEKN